MQTRTLEILAQLRELITPEIDALMCELEELTSYTDGCVWNPADACGQAVKEGARECFYFVGSTMHQVMGARTIINETLSMADDEVCE